MWRISFRAGDESHSFTLHSKDARMFVKDVGSAQSRDEGLFLRVKGIGSAFGVMGFRR